MPISINVVVLRITNFPVKYGPDPNFHGNYGPDPDLPGNYGHDSNFPRLLYFEAMSVGYCIEGDDSDCDGDVSFHWFC